MVIKFLSILSALVAVNLSAYAKQIINTEYRFSIDIPEDWQITAAELPGEGIRLSGQKGESYFVILAFHAGENKRFNIRKALNGSNFPDITNASISTNIVSAPWWNLLRNSKFCQYRTPNGIEIGRLTVLRDKTAFELSVEGPQAHFAELKQILDSFDSKLTTYSYFLIARNNLGFFGGSILLTCFPLLGLFAGLRFRKWTRSCRLDRKALLHSILFAAPTIILLAYVFIALQDCMRLAWMVEAALLICWIVFAANSEFLKAVYYEIFSN